MRVLALVLMACAAPAQDLYFQARTQSPLGEPDMQGATTAAVADFNKDGRLDLAVPSNQGNVLGIAVFHGNGDGTFRPAIKFRTGQPCSWLAVADIDSDGYIDLVGVDPRLNRVFTYMGRPAGSFSPGYIFSAGSSPGQIALADFNGDGNPDVAVLDRARGELLILIGDGAGNFRTLPGSRTGDEPYLMAVADFNADGVPDVVTANMRSRSATLLLGNGDGSFRQAAALLEGEGPYSPAAGDFNGDGVTDLAFGTVGENIAVLYGHGDGTFDRPAWYSLGRQAFLTAADWNGDGKADLLASVWLDSRVLALPAAEGGFGDVVETSVDRPNVVVPGDFNGDGLPDAVAVSSTYGTAAVLLNDNFRFRVAAELGAARPSAVIAADLNKDGKADVAVAAMGVSGVWVFEGFGDGSFKSPVRYPAGAGPTALEIADFNQDGAPDLATANYDSGDVSLLLNRGNGTYLPPVRAELGAYCTPIALTSADFNRDGFPDLAVLCPNLMSVDLLFSRGTEGGFEAPHTLWFTKNPLSVAAADFTGDGNADLALAIPQNSTVQLLPGNGDGTFRSALEFAAGRNPNRLVAADINGDKRPDLLANGMESIVMLLGSEGGFQRREITTGRSSSALMVADLTGDGDPDVAANYPSASIIGFLAGDRTGSFRPAGELGFASAPGSMAAADFNGDGRADLVVSEPGAAVVSIFLSGSGSQTALESPALLSPADDAVITQNDSSTGCPANQMTGAGYRINLQWVPRSGTVEGYGIIVTRQGAARPMVETTLPRNMTGFNMVSCGFVSDSELEGWQWQVRARDTIGNFSPWSESRHFRFAPCRLADGRACGTTPPPGPPPPAPGNLRMSVARSRHTATVLNGGKVLIAGGYVPSSQAIVASATAEVYDPVAGKFTLTGSLSVARAHHTATLLANGKALLTGGWGTGAVGQTPPGIAAAEIYDPNTGTFTATGSLTAPRADHVAVRLSDGRVLVTGGANASGVPVSTAEIYNPETGKFTALTPMQSARREHTATLLRDGRVLIAGGIQGDREPPAEYFVPATGSFQAGPRMVQQRSRHTASLLSDGRVLIVGGVFPQNQAVPIAELFDPAAGTFTEVPGPSVSRWYHTTAAFNLGVLVVGGFTGTDGTAVGTTELFNIGARMWTPGPTIIARGNHAAAQIAGDRLLITGGTGGDSRTLIWLDSAELVPTPPQ